MSESSFDSGFYVNNDEASPFSSSDENYMAEIDRMLQRYEEAAKTEQFYLLQFSFVITNSHYTIDCGLSPARSFCPIIRLRTQSTRITFSSYEWTEFVKMLRKLSVEFFKNSAEANDVDYLPFFCGDLPFVTMSKIVYEDNVKQVMVMKQLSTLYLSEDEVEQILNIDSNLISHRMTLLENLNFCMYYFDALNTIRQTNNLENAPITDLLCCFCDSEGSTLLSNALRDYIYYYGDSVFSDFNNKCI